MSGEIWTPGVDYTVRWPGAYTDCWDMAHLRLKTNAPQPTDWDLGFQHFNEIHEYSQEEIFRAQYVGSIRAHRRMELIKRLSESFDIHAQHYLAEGYEVEMPTHLWLFSDSGMRLIRIEVVEGVGDGVLI